MLEEKELIMCGNCYEKNETGRKYCKKCKNELSYSKKVEYEDASNSSNVIAKKIEIFVMFVKVVACILAIINLVILSSETGKFLIPLLVSVGIIAVAWISTLMLEAIAEGLNLLQDIKNKRK